MTAPFGATGVSIDTRTLQPGDLFVALAGENGDGHDHVQAAALAEGAAAGALVQRWMPGSIAAGGKHADRRFGRWAASPGQRFTGRRFWP